MMTANKTPGMRPRELRDGSGWYVLVEWGDRPSEQVGGFQTESEARAWIEQDAPGWLRKRFAEPGPA
jgi:hypothetical protein